MKQGNLLLGILFICLVCGACKRRAPQHQLVVPNNGSVRIATETLADGGVHFFTYQHVNKNINFFVRTDGNGTLRTHFDACYSCFKYKLGYVWQEEEVICIACRIGYRLKDPIWDYIGACAPIVMRMRHEEQQLVIRLEWLIKGEKFF